MDPLSAFLAGALAAALITWSVSAALTKHKTKALVDRSASLQQQLTEALTTLATKEQENERLGAELADQRRTQAVLETRAEKIPELEASLRGAQEQKDAIGDELGRLKQQFAQLQTLLEQERRAYRQSPEPPRRLKDGAAGCPRVIRTPGGISHGSQQGPGSQGRTYY